MHLNKLRSALIQRKIPKHIRLNFRTIDAGKMEQLRGMLRQDFFANQSYSSGMTSEKYLQTDEGKADLDNHAAGRLGGFRSTIIPWLDSMKPLKSARVLEIGCGTGCSSLALAEQGAIVTGVDVEEPSIKVAKRRLEFYGADADMFLENATAIDRFDKQGFDFIIFFATLEHMTIDERIVALKKAWEMLPTGGILVVIETPNRLWHRDDHTSMLPFFHWLPDQLALYYSARSPRRNFFRFANALGSPIPMTFHRLGRGASYHEFEIAIGDISKLKIVGDLEPFLVKRSIDPLKPLKKKMSLDYRFHKLIRGLAPGLHKAFFHQDLNLAILKE